MNHIDKDKKWDEIEKKYQLGDKITGIVVRHEKFGIFLDIFENPIIGFIRIVGICDDPTKVYDSFPPIGSNVKGIIVQLTKDDYQIVVSIKPSDLLL